MEKAKAAILCLGVVTYHYYCVLRAANLHYSCLRALILNVYSTARAATTTLSCIRTPKHFILFYHVLLIHILPCVFGATINGRTWRRDGCMPYYYSGPIPTTLFHCVDVIDSNL